MRHEPGAKSMPGRAPPHHDDTIGKASPSIARSESRSAQRRAIIACELVLPDGAADLLEQLRAARATADQGGAAGAGRARALRAKLHDLDAEAHLRDVMRVLPLWPADRYPERRPENWAATRARLDAAEVEQETGWLTIPSSPTS